MAISATNFFHQAWLMEFEASYKEHEAGLDDLHNRLEILLGRNFYSGVNLQAGKVMFVACYMNSPERDGPLGECHMALELDGTFSIHHNFHDVHYDNTKTGSLNFYDASRLFIARISDNYEGKDRAKVQDFLMGAIDEVKIEGKKVVLQERAPEMA